MQKVLTIEMPKGSKEMFKDLSAEYSEKCLKIKAEDNDKNKIAETLSSYIIDNYETKIITKILNTDYPYFSQADKKEILKNILENSKIGTSVKGNIFYNRRKRLLTKMLVDYIENNDELVMDGFVNFRTGDYRRELEDMTEIAVDEFLVNREYNEFINLLRFFVETQPERDEVIHVLPHDKGYRIINSELTDITKEVYDSFINEIPLTPLHSEDLLISALIMLAPIKLVIHRSLSIKHQEVLNTINSIFAPGVVYCESCILCLPEQEIKS